jgi:hypothetical protein
MPSRETVLRGSIILIANIPAMPATEQNIKKKCRKLDFFIAKRPPKDMMGILSEGRHFEVQ